MQINGLRVVQGGLLKDATRTRTVDDVANLALGDIDKQSAEIGAFHAVPGVAVLRAPLRVQETYALGSKCR